MTDNVNDRDLATLQHWMQDVVAGESWTLDDALSVAAQYGIDCDAAIVGTERLPARQRLEIYVVSYRMRLIECLRAEFPVLRRFVGDQVFDLFAGAYLGAKPPSSYTLFDLGAGFADFLEAARPQPNDGRGTLEALPASLARLERAFAEVERAPGIEGGERSLFPAPFDIVLLHALRLRAPASLRLLRLDFDFSSLIAAVAADQPFSNPAAGDTHVAVARSHYRVRLHRLEPWSFSFLSLLGDTEGSVRDLIPSVAGELGRAQDEISAQLLMWLPFALDAGLLVAA
ncbi:HvfC/BufC N-terminal domain-containing protein [Trinickia acidisoli]|uniref:HvfC/BufC N-terminal domain-containing protein n=1 Tax=Trinickia acidisoli TaxID=2767482 RepID=UPI001A8D6371|nr:DNA-binding domain-containing protein [Trinickia acidisoli]